MKVPRRGVKSGAVAAGLHHSHSNAGFDLCLRSTPQLMATLDLNPLSEARDRTCNLMIPVRFVASEPRQELLLIIQRPSKAHSSFSTKCCTGVTAPPARHPQMAGLRQDRQTLHYHFWKWSPSRFSLQRPCLIHINTSNAPKCPVSHRLSVRS